MALVYKICTPDEHAAALAGPWAGSALDRRDGFVHLSSADQVAGTLTRYYQGVRPLFVLAVDPARLADGALRWERSRDDQLFPHLYAALEPGAIVGVERLD